MLVEGTVRTYFMNRTKRMNALLTACRVFFFQQVEYKQGVQK